MFIVVLGGGINLSGKLPNHVYQRLDKAVEIYQSLTNSVRPSPVGQSNKNEIKIVVTGKYSFLYDQLGKYPPTTEAEKMAEYLLAKKIPKENILMEKKSKDTIGNAYYLKINFFLPRKIHQAIIITSYFHLERIKYIFNKIFGPKYHFQFVGVEDRLPPDEERRVITRQKELLVKIKGILSPMKTGNHHFLDKKLYKIKYYREKRPDWVINFVAKGK